MIQYLVEFIGTMFLTIIIFSTGNYLAIGAALGVLVLLGGNLSGGAYNPAVAISLFAGGKINSTDTLLYIIVEILGGLAGFEFFNKFIK